ncbi:hypothetical protein [Dactylosporangium matsuzakiense]|uniref:Uncharacterized protein n=1 Tax=Dactylosporangium matsuzakiense TaxID=53360 RepID=A0A9W6NIT1_9ACTN|nr:hypothetical protein [Dactylosporangium matsuzakiense]UWZ44942.1 hypothetical protein Dmats_47890 [Dactylosporangium matsuzakiense]GLK99154.1 hypothetical protein GCM10017581_008950 [Dactylosporangium matsuzakiense]
MSFAVPAGPRARPSTVSLASTLLFVAAGLEVISVVLSLLYAGKIAENTKKIYEDAGVQANANASTSIGSTVGVVFGFLIVVILVLLGYFVSRGNQVARILTWVVGGIALCCSVIGLGASLLTQTFWDAGRRTYGELPTWDSAKEAMYAGIPGWYEPVSTILGILIVLAIAVPIILLALPASHPYFRKQEAQWEPPVPGSGGPGGFPGQPGEPGQPGAPGWPPSS